MGKTRAELLTINPFLFYFVYRVDIYFIQKKLLKLKKLVKYFPWYTSKFSSEKKIIMIISCRKVTIFKFCLKESRKKIIFLMAGPFASPARPVRK